MFKFTRILALGISISACASGAVLTWSSPGLSDNNGGSFLAGSSLNTAGLTAIFTLPNFTQSDFAFFSGEVDLSITATYDYPWINGVRVTFFGTVDQTNGPASVDYIQTASGSPGSPASGNLTSLPFSFALFLSGASTVNLTTQLNLNDNGGLAGVSSVEFGVSAPEPATTSAMAAGVALLALLRRSRRAGAVNR